MLRKRTHGSRRSADHRPAVWPWVLMPLAALALFFALRAVRHTAGIGRPAHVTATRNTASP